MTKFQGEESIVPDSSYVIEDFYYVNVILLISTPINFHFCLVAYYCFHQGKMAKNWLKRKKKKNRKEKAAFN